MTSREKRFVAIGIFMGMAVAASVVAALRLSRVEVASVTANHAEHVAQPSAAADPGQPAESGDSPTGLAIDLTEEEQRKVGLETSEIQARALRSEVRAVGRVEQPETALNTISARISGRIDKLFINFTGQAVSKGDPVALIYSPQVVTTGQEYKLALEHRERMKDSTVSGVLETSDELVQAARRRLELWGLTREQIENIAASPETPIHVTVYSSASGIVINREVSEGQYVNEGGVLLTLTDLSRVWVKADIFESDISTVRNGQPVTITGPALPGSQQLKGTVSFIEPTVSEETRTVPVRIEVNNPQMRLRPGMYVDVTLTSAASVNVPVVPRSAVIDTGTGKIVYVTAGDGVFERRSVKLGEPREGYFPVISGLRPGEHVVTHGAFLIDSQTRLTGGITGLFSGSRAFDSAPETRSPRSDASVVFRTKPDPPEGGTENTAHVSVTDASGNPVQDAQVKVTIIMPAMPSMGMPEMRSSADLVWNGSEYTGKLSIPMAGPWNVMVEVRRAGRLLTTYRTRFDAS